MVGLFAVILLTSNSFYILKFMRKLGIRFSPPALVLIYNVSSSKLHKRIMPIRNFRIDSNVSFVASQLRLRHEPLQLVPVISIEKMLRMLQENIKGLPLDKIQEKITSEFAIDPNEDMNKLTEEDLERKKQIMEASFALNQVQPSDPEFQYDKQVEFDENKIESGWDTEDGAAANVDENDDFWS